MGNLLSTNGGGNKSLHVMQRSVWDYSRTLSPLSSFFVKLQTPVPSSAIGSSSGVSSAKNKHNLFSTCLSSGNPSATATLGVQRAWLTDFYLTSTDAGPQCKKSVITGL